MHLFYCCEGSERILQHYAPDLRRYLDKERLDYVLGVLCFDYLNCDKDYEEMKSEICKTKPLRSIPGDALVRKNDKNVKTTDIAGPSTVK